ncbi:MAG: DUF4391 domain-containing protein [Dehalococcoidia bacterium]
MTAFFDYPRSAAFGRVVPKSKIYGHAGANTALKDLFVREVDQIVWRFKLAPETINLAATKSVTEIQVFEVTLKTGKLDEDVLRAIDKAVPFPLVFELTFGGRRKATAAFKRPNEADRTKWVISEYFDSAWAPEGTPRAPLPVALNLGALYEKILNALMPVQVQTDEDIQARVARMEAIRAKTREIERIKARLTREKQFNKRVAINAELREAKLELERLTPADAPKSGASE